MLLCDVVDKLHDEHGLADARAAEQAYLTALEVRRNEVYDLNTGFKDFVGSLLLFERGGGTMNFPLFLGFGLGLVVYRVAEKVEYTSEGSLSDGYLDRSACVNCLHASDKTVRAAHRDAAHDIVADMLRDLYDQLGAIVVDLNGVQQVRQAVGRKSYIKHRSDDLHDRAYVLV